MPEKGSNVTPLDREQMPSASGLPSMATAIAARWQGFSEQELRTIAGALGDSGGMRSDYEWYKRCEKLYVELLKWAAAAQSPASPAQASNAPSVDGLACAAPEAESLSDEGKQDPSFQEKSYE